jgi:hypothetical protein
MFMGPMRTFCRTWVSHSRGMLVGRARRNGDPVARRVLRDVTSTLTVIATIACVAFPVVAGEISLQPAGAVSTPPCSTNGLVVWINTMGSGTAGGTYYNLELTNLSGHECHLLGFPGVSGVNLGGHQLGSSASRNRAIPSRAVTLESGSTATAILRITDVGNFSRSMCAPTTAAGLRVYPPNQFASKVIPFPFAACSKVGPTYLSVEPVQASAITASSICQPAQLKIAQSGSGGAAGTIEFSFSLTNISSLTCTMYGYPGMELLNAGGPLPTNTVRGGGLSFEEVGPTDVSLSPGQVAYFNLGFSDVPSGTTGCSMASQVEITPPNDFAYATVPVSPIDACENGTLHVSPVFASTNATATATTAPRQ